MSSTQMTAPSTGQTVLQILTPPSNPSAAAGGGVGGGWGEWAQKYASLGCVATCTALMVGAALAVAIGALVFVYDENASLTCVGDLAGISFSYITWLRVMGFTFIGGMALEIIFVFAHGMSGTVFTSKAATWFGLLFYVFETAWYIVGAILYWKTVTTNCTQGSQIQAFSLALFIIQTTVVVCLFCGRRAAVAVA